MAKMSHKQRADRAKSRNLKRRLTHLDAEQAVKLDKISLNGVPDEAPIALKRGDQVKLRGVARPPVGFSTVGRQDAGACGTVLSSQDRYGMTVLDIKLRRSGIVLKTVPLYDVVLINDMGLNGV